MGWASAQCVAKGHEISQVAEGDLDAHALGAEAARISHQAADGNASGRKSPQHRKSNRSGGAGQQQHGGGAVSSSTAAEASLRRTT